MTGGPQSQPNSALYAHVCPEVDCIYYGKRTDPRGCGCHRTREQMMLARIEELKARAEQAEQAVDVLESNARVQAKLLADTGRRVEELEAALRFIADGYDNHDVNHVDYRVKVYQVALDALGLARGGKES